VQIAPRYGPDPIITMDGDATAILEPLLRQRRRLAATVAAFDEEQWATPSRCEGWTAQDVIRHLIGVDQFWRLSIERGSAGAPTRYLAGFDPKATPATMVDGGRAADPHATRDEYLAAVDDLGALVESLSDEQWASTAESPVGHVSVSVVAHHGLWDCWIHERDILLPLGVEPVREPDEVRASLRYAAALGPGFSLQTGARDGGAIVIAATDPDDRLLVAVTDHVAVGPAPGASIAVDAQEEVLTADAVELLEALSVRGPWPATVSTQQRAFLGGLETVFETVQPAT
jgi:uncharacterized protein (TIGR03083 family)